MGIITLDKTKELKGKVVTINGSFDLVHDGHIQTLKEAKAQGDVLVVGVNSDKSVRSYKNGQGPIIPEKHRASLIASIRYVDHVVLFDEPNPVEFIKAVKPAVHCNAAGYGADCVEAKAIKQVGGKLHLIPDNVGGLSTSMVFSEISKRNDKTTKAVFLDRDGVLNVDIGYTHKVADLKIPPGAAEGLKSLSDLGYSLIIVSNQSGIARGYFGEKELEKFNTALFSAYAKEGVTFEKAYHCPHHPDFTGECDCRKPRAALLNKAKKEFNIDMGNSILIGDQDSDITAGKKASVGKTFLIRSEQKCTSGPDHIVDDIRGVLESIR